MLDFNSDEWGTLRHAYGDASDTPGIIRRLRAASAREWDAVMEELRASILHQGDVFTATYAAMPHLLQLAIDLGPSKQPDELLWSLTFAARGAQGSDCPASLEDDWHDAQEEALEIMLE